MKKSFVATLIVVGALAVLQTLLGASRRESRARSAARGETVFFQRCECASCHATKLDEVDSEGPNLTSHKLSRDQIEQAIREPSRDFAPGYKRVQIQLSDGTMLEGAQEESDVNETVVAVRSGDARLRLIPRTEIEGIEALPSSMPDGQAEGLTDQELADLIEYVLGLSRRDRAYLGQADD